MNNGMTPQQVQAMIDASIKKAQYSVTHNPLHAHTGTDGSPRIPQANIIPTIRAEGSIKMATDATTYTLGTPQNNVPTSILMYGAAVHRTAGSIDIRAFITGSAQLGQSYYFQPQSGTSVITGGPMQNFTQSCAYFLIDSTTTPFTVNTKSTDTHLVSVEYPSGTPVARATVTAFSKNTISILTALSSGWEIDANFVVS